MPIFSANRVSGIGSTVVAAEGYTENDFGRILSECAINDMRLFNAAIARDFKEAQAMQEGTMMQSEIQALQEFSVKEAWKGLKEKIKKLWAKIKGVFKTVYAKLSLWLVRNNKAYIAMHRKELLTKNCSACKCPKFRNPKGDYLANIAVVDNIKIEDLKKAAEFLKGEALDEIVKLIGSSAKEANISDSEYSATLKEIDSMEEVSADKVYESLMDDLFEKPNDNLTFGKTIYNGSARALMDNLSASSNSLKTLKKMSAGTDKIFKNVLKKLNDAEKKAESGSSEQKGYSLASKFISKFQTVSNALISGCIKVVRKGINNDRGLIATLVAYNPKAKNESALLEAAYMVGHDAFFLETEDMDAEGVAAEAEEEGVTITIDIDGDDDVDVDVNDNTDE